MKLETAKALHQLAQDHGYDVELYEDYSGRGMYGRTTAGLTVPCIGHRGFSRLPLQRG